VLGCQPDGGCARDIIGWVVTSLRAAPLLDDTIAALEKGSGVLGRLGIWLAAATDLGTGSVGRETGSGVCLDWTSFDGWFCSNSTG
jgi:hypothetical protein